MTDNGRVIIDTEAADADLMVLRMRGALHFTGGDMDLIHRHYGKPLSELSEAEGSVAGAYVYLRRAVAIGLIVLPEGVSPSWEIAADQMAIERAEEPMDPTNGASSPTSPPSPNIGAITPATSSG